MWPRTPLPQSKPSSTAPAHKYLPLTLTPCSYGGDLVSPPQLLQHPWVAQGSTTAGEHDLSHFKQSMKAYNARRKFKATIMTVQLMSALARANGGVFTTKEGVDGGGARYALV